MRDLEKELEDLQYKYDKLHNELRDLQLTELQIQRHIDEAENEFEDQMITAIALARITDESGHFVFSFDEILQKSQERYHAN